MNIDTIVSLALAGVQLITIFAYMAILKKSNKKDASSEINKILGLIPNYIAIATETMPGASTLKITNFVLAMIKNECEEAKVKIKEKTIKEAIEHEIEV